VSEDTIAKMQDLIRGTGSEKRVYIPSLKKEVIIKKLSIGEIADIYKGTKDDFERVLFMLWKGLVEPKPKSFSEVRQLKDLETMTPDQLYFLEKGYEKYLKEKSKAIRRRR